MRTRNIDCFKNLMKKKAKTINCPVYDLELLLPQPDQDQNQQLGQSLPLLDQTLRGILLGTLSLNILDLHRVAKICWDRRIWLDNNLFLKLTLFLSYAAFICLIFSGTTWLTKIIFFLVWVVVFVLLTVWIFLNSFHLICRVSTGSLYFSQTKDSISPCCFQNSDHATPRNTHLFKLNEWVKRSR